MICDRWRRALSDELLQHHGHLFPPQCALLRSFLLCLSLSLSPVMCGGLSLSTAAPGASSLSDKHTKGRLHQKVETRTCCCYLEPFWSDGPRTLTQPVPMACDGGGLNTKLNDVKFDSGFHSSVTCLTKCPITTSKGNWSKRRTDATMTCLHDSWHRFVPNLAMLFRCVFH